MTIPLRIALELERVRRHHLVAVHPLQQLFWECTLHCNIHCLHCGSDCRKEPISSAQTPPLEEFLHVLDREIIPHCSPLPLIILSGGEPTTRPDLIAISQQLHLRGFRWGMVTNGLAMTEELFQSLLHNGLSSLTVSIDGLEPEHTWLRGSKQVFSAAIHVVEMAMKSQQSGYPLAFDVVTCVHRRNLSTLPQLRDMLRTYGLTRWRLFTIAPMGRAADHPDLQLSSTEYQHLLDFIASERVRYDQGLTSLLPAYACEGFLGPYEGRVRSHLYHCAAGVTVASILADGSISACTSIRGNYHQGNIHTDSFWDVWQHRFEAYRHRDWMKRTEPCRSCSFFRYCEGNGMHLRRTDGTLMHCNLHMVSGEW